MAKAQLDMAVRPPGDRWAVTHDATGMAARVAPRQTMAPPLLVLEATGGDQRAVVAALAAVGLPVVVVNPRPARDVANAPGQLATTAVLEARTLAHVAAAVRPPPRPLPDAPTEERRALLARRRPLVARRTAAQNRLGGASQRLRVDSQAHLTGLNTPVAPRDAERDTSLRASPLWRAPAALLRSVPGMGPVGPRPLRLALPEGGPLSRQRLAALVGVAPWHRDRGPRRGVRATWGGRAQVRTT